MQFAPVLKGQMEYRREDDYSLSSHDALSSRTSNTCGLGMTFKEDENGELHVCSAGWNCQNVQPGDILMEINGIEVCNTKPEDLAALCQGVEGSTCIATFRRPPQKYPYQVTLIRKPIVKPTANGGIYKILDGLYIGGIEGAKDYMTLQRESITHVLNMVGPGLYDDPLAGGREQSYFPQFFKYKIITTYDNPEQDLLSYFPETSRFIHEGRMSGGILVHCYAGVSRSAAVIMAYMIDTLKVDAATAFYVLQRGRPQAHPNVGFQKQIKQYEAMHLGGGMPWMLNMGLPNVSQGMFGPGPVAMGMTEKRADSLLKGGNDPTISGRPGHTEMPKSGKATRNARDTFNQETPSSDEMVDSTDVNKKETVNKGTSRKQSDNKSEKEKKQHSYYFHLRRMLPWLKKPWAEKKMQREGASLSKTRRQVKESPRNIPNNIESRKSIGTESAQEMMTQKSAQEIMASSKSELAAIMQLMTQMQHSLRQHDTAVEEPETLKPLAFHSEAPDKAALRPWQGPYLQEKEPSKFMSPEVKHAMLYTPSKPSTLHGLDLKQEQAAYRLLTGHSATRPSVEVDSKYQAQNKNASPPAMKYSQIPTSSKMIRKDKENVSPRRKGQGGSNTIQERNHNQSGSYLSQYQQKQSLSQPPTLSPKGLRAPRSPPKRAHVHNQGDAVSNFLAGLSGCSHSWSSNVSAIPQRIQAIPQQIE